MLLEVHAWVSQGSPGKRDDLDDRRADATRPASGKRKRMGQGKWRHEPSPKKSAGLKRWETA